jgi:hypothetical protein
MMKKPPQTPPKTLGASRDELQALRSIGAMERDARGALMMEERVKAFEEKLEKVVRKLEPTLKVAARRGWKEHVLIKLDVPGLIDEPRLFTGNAPPPHPEDDRWRRFNPYQDKSIVRNPALLALWERLEALGLRPIFIPEDRSLGHVFAVQLPDGGPYPREHETGYELAWHTATRMAPYVPDEGES